MLPSQAGAAAALGRGSALGGSLNRTPTGRPGGGGTRGANGGRVPGNGAGLGSGRLEREAAAAAATTPAAPTAGALYSGSEGDSESGEEEELGAERRGLKRSLSEMEMVVAGPEASAAAAGGYGPVSGAVSGAKPGKKTRGRVKIKMEFIDNKLRRYTTFSKRKTGIMKKVPKPGGLPACRGRSGGRPGGMGTRAWGGRLGSWGVCVRERGEGGTGREASSEAEVRSSESAEVCGRGGRRQGKKKWGEGEMRQRPAWRGRAPGRWE